MRLTSLRLPRYPPLAPVLALSLSVLALSALSACGSTHPSAAQLAGAEERVGIDRPLANCVASAAERDLAPSERRLLGADPGNLAPKLAAKVTRLVAVCAITTAPPYASRAASLGR